MKWRGRYIGLAVKWTETVSRQAYAVRPPVYSIVYDEKLVTSLTPVNPDVRGRILSSNLEDVRINQEGVEGGKLFSYRIGPRTACGARVVRDVIGPPA